MARRSTFEVVADEMNGGHTTRKPLLEKLEKLLDRRVIAFFTSFMHPHGIIDDTDVDILVDLLNAREAKEPKALSR